jgi:chromosomal replication initiation ATPase DnaA
MACPEALQRRTDRIEEAIRIACERHGGSRKELLEGHQYAPVATVRGEVCRALRREGMTYHSIARALNMGDHTSVLYHCRKVALLAIGLPVPAWQPDEADESGVWAI